MPPAMAAAPAGFPVPPMPGLQFELIGYANRVRALGILWLAYAGLSLILGFAALAFAHAFLAHGFGPWMNGPWANGPWSHGDHMPPDWFIPMAMRFAWLVMIIRAALCAVAGWGLLERTDWGRIVAIVAAVLSLIKFPFGTALGIATLVILLGYRNSTLYQRL
jgi:hypothetical protein